MFVQTRLPRISIAALIIFMLALLSACGQPGIAPLTNAEAAIEAAAPSDRPSGAPSTTISAGTQPSTSAQSGRQEPASTAVPLLWPEPLPDGLRVDAAQSSIDAGGWTLQLIDPDDPQGIMWIRGGSGAWAEPRPGSRTVLVRGVEGNAFSTGAGWGVTWTEGPEGAAYNVGGFLLSAESAVAIAETLQPVDEATFRQRLAGGGIADKMPAVGADRQLVYVRFDATQQRSELRAIALDGDEEVLPALPGRPVPTAQPGRPGRLLTSTAPGCTISGLAVSPDREWIAFSVDGCRTPGLHIIGADGNAERVLVEGSSQIGAFAFGPDGSRIALLRMRNADPAPVPETSLWTVAVDSGALTPVVPWAYFMAMPAWLDNGLLIFSQAAGGTPPTDWTTYSVEAYADAEPQALRAGQMLAPAPQRDALLMAWETQPGAGGETVRVGLLPLGEEPRLLDQAPGPLPAAAWSPDGASIAIYDWNVHKLQTVEVSSGQRRDVAQSVQSMPGIRTAWTADGKLVAAMGMQDEAVELRIYERTSGQARVVATIDSLPDFVVVTK